MADREEGLSAYPVPLPVNPFTNPDLREKSTLGFRPDPMAETVRGLPARLMQNADESLTKNIMAYMPKPKESRYGSIRMPRASDDPMNAGAFVMAGPIAVEEALGKFAAKALPGKVIETKLLQMGASKAELETRGVTQYLESQGTRPVHPLEVMKHLDDNPFQLNEVVKTPQQNIKKFDPRIGAYEDTIAPGSTKFDQWQTPGGENYREILLQAPEPPKTNMNISFDEWRKYIGSEQERLERLYDAATTTTEKHNIRQDIIKLQLKGIDGPPGWDPSKLAPRFEGGHWDEPNVVAHMRVNDRKLPSGEKALHVEEWQSDWAIANRETAKRIEEGVPDRPTNFLTPHKPRLDPSHPLVDNWQDLMARRTLKEAVDGGYDRLTWTTGQQQADRYDLSKQITKVTYNPKTEVLDVIDKSGEPQTLGGLVKPEEIQDYVGKDVARKLLASPQQTGGPYKIDMVHSISGLDLKMGGEWATKLYDESMVNRFNKIGKRYGVKVEDVPLTKTKGVQYRVGHGESEKIIPPVAHSIKITPEMKESIGGSRFHPFADLPGPKPKVAPTPPPTPAAAKKVDLSAEAATLDPGNPVRYVGDQMGYPLLQQEPPGVGSFIVRPGESVADAYARAKARYQK